MSYQDAPAENSATPVDETKPATNLPTTTKYRQTESLKGEVLAREKEFFQALTKHDAAAIANFLTDDYTLIDARGFADKAEYVRRQQGSRASYELLEARVTPFGEEYAVVIRKLVEDGTKDGKLVQTVFYGHEDWLKHNGKWRIRGSDNTRAR